MPVIFSERLVSPEEVKIDSYISVEGQFRSYNNYNNKNGRKLMLLVFAREMEFHEEEVTQKNPNQIFLNGFVCRKPQYRTTPFGREISDILLAVNRAYNKSDYIPCIAWEETPDMPAPSKWGTISRYGAEYRVVYIRRSCPTIRLKKMVAYEISVSKMEVVKENNNKMEEKGD